MSSADLLCSCNPYSYATGNDFAWSHFCKVALQYPCGVTAGNIILLDMVVCGNLMLTLQQLFEQPGCHMLQGFFRDLTNLTSVSGLNSGIYSALTASFVLAGLTYIGFPTQSLTAIFGTAAEKGLEDIFLWQLVGTAVSMVVAPIAFTQQVAAQAIQGTWF